MKLETLSRLAMMLVILSILDYTSRVVRIFPTPNGGSLSFVPITFAVVAIIAKPLEGLLFGVVASLFTFLIGFQWFVNPIQWVFDYPVALGGGIMLGSIVWTLLEKTKIPYALRVATTTLSITTFQFFSYTIALWAYVGETIVQGIGKGFWSNSILFIKYNAVYMVPIMIANIVVTAIMFPRIKKYLKR